MVILSLCRHILYLLSFLKHQLADFMNGLILGLSGFLHLLTDQPHDFTLEVASEFLSDDAEDLILEGVILNLLLVEGGAGLASQLAIKVLH
jgi:riboflavin biosynthesis pyrimidine reductase